MCKRFNIGIVLFIIVSLTLSGCIRKLNLYQGDKDGDDGDDGEVARRQDVICKTDFMYPFGTEHAENFVKLIPQTLRPKQMRSTS